MAYGPYSNYPNKKPDETLGAWILAVVMLAVFPPVGFFLLFRQLMRSVSPSYRNRHPYDVQRQQQEQRTAEAQRTAQEAARRASGSRGEGPAAYWEPTTAHGKAAKQAKKATYAGAVYPNARGVKIKDGKRMTVAGAVLALVGFLGTFGALSELAWSASIFSFLASLLPMITLTGAGGILCGVGAFRSKKAKRFRRYLPLIGKSKEVTVAALSKAMSVPYHTVCDDLQDMLDEGYLPYGYLDMSTGKLILSEDGLRMEPEEKEEPPRQTIEESERVLREIREVNDAIAHAEMTRKIDRIGEITARIYAYSKEHPEREKQLHSFLSYYLPTTLKILRSYAQLEAQGIEGENITAAKERIEGMMDKVVEGFEKQLDQLFQNTAMDITSDVAVLERMLDKDGLSGSGGMTMTL